jgi:uncharacterized protein (TIGR00369 family)
MASRELEDVLGACLPEGFHFGDVMGLRRTASIAGEASFEIEIGPQHLNRHGTVHGGVLMAMLDTAGLWAISDPNENAAPKAVTVSLNCSFVGTSGAEDSKIRATGRISKAGRRTYFASIIAESQPSGQLVATAQGIYNKTG